MTRRMRGFSKSLPTRVELLKKTYWPEATVNHSGAAEQEVDKSKARDRSARLNMHEQPPQQGTEAFHDQSLAIPSHL